MNFIYRNGSQLYERNTRYRFISFNIPNLFIIEDPYWHQSTAFEQSDALLSINEMGGKAVRVYPFSFQKGIDDYPRHFSFEQGKWILNEVLFRDVDRALVLANSSNVRIIIPFIDKWDYWGGIPTFTVRNNLDASKFFTDASLREQFKSVIQTVLNRANSINGVLYKDDPTILAWETGNELDYLGGRVPAEWTLEISKFIKDIDGNHLIIDGSNGAFGWDHAVLSDSSIDIYSNHYYHSLENNQLITIIVLPLLWIIILGFLIRSFFQNSSFTKAQMYINSVILILVAIGFTISATIIRDIFPDIATRYISDDNLVNFYNKVMFVGELGLHKWTDMDNLITKFITRNSTCGVLIWSLRFHAEPGGFCIFTILIIDTHEELQNYQAYHYPGFAEAPGFGKDEIDVFRMMKDQISKLNRYMNYSDPVILKPISPIIWNNGSNLYMKGSYGASSYILQYSASSDTFATVKEFLDNVNYGTFVSTLDKPGVYRVLASNSKGYSDPSNAIYY